MTCGHCVRSITEAVQAADPAAKVQVDSTASRDVLVQHLVEAGYTPA